MITSLRKRIRKCSLMALWKPFGYTFHLKQTAWKNFANSRKGAPLNFGFFETRADFSAQVFLKGLFLYEKESEFVRWWLFGKRLDIPFIQNESLAKKIKFPEMVRPFHFLIPFRREKFIWIKVALKKRLGFRKGQNWGEHQFRSSQNFFSRLLSTERYIQVLSREPLKNFSDPVS